MIGEILKAFGSSPLPSNLLWIDFFLKDFFVNLFSIVLVTLFLIVLTYIGTVYFRFFLKYRSLQIVIPGGMAFGIAIIVMFLGLFSYFLKGVLGLWIIFSLYIACGLFLQNKYRKLLKLDKIYFRPSKIFWYVPHILISLMIIIFGANATYGGDTLSHFNIVSSYARGNYPMVSPWQPDRLLIYHQGSFMLEGLIQSITKVNIRPVHYLLTSYAIIAGFFLLTGFLSYKSKSIFSFTPSLLGYIAFGAIFLLLPDGLINLPIKSSLSYFPTLTHANGSLGGLSQFSDLFFLTPRSTALTVLILYFIVLIGDFIGGRKKQIILLAALAGSILSIDETIFTGILLPTVFWYGRILMQSKNRLGWLKDGLISLSIFLLLFFILGNTVRDSFLTPPKEAARFKFESLSEILSTGKLNWLNPASFLSERSPGLVWYLPDYRVVIVVTLILAILWGGELGLIFSLASLGVFLLFIFITQTFYRGNEIRFLHQSYQYTGFSLGLVIFNLLNMVSHFKKTRALGVILLILIVPSLMSALWAIKIAIPTNHYTNFYPRGTTYPVMDWMTKNLRYDQRVFFIDGFLRDKKSSELNINGSEVYGFFIPTAPAKVLVNIHEWGPEIIDVIYTLSPSAIRELNIKYLFIANDQLKYYSIKRQEEIKNDQYFVSVYKDSTGTLFRVEQAYYNREEEAESFVNLKSQIKPNSKVFIEDYPRIDYNVRGSLFLTLKYDSLIYTSSGPGFFGYVETPIDNKQPSPDIEYNYLILNSQTDPLIACRCNDIKLIWQTWGVKAYAAFY